MSRTRPATTSGRRTISASLRMQREVGRSSYGAIFVNRQGYGQHSRSTRTGTAPMAFDANIQMTQNQRVSAFIARTDTPDSRHDGSDGQRLFRPRVLQLHQQPLAGLRRVLAGRRELQSRSRLPAAARLPSSGVPRVLLSRSRRRLTVDPPHLAAHVLQRRSTTSTAICRPRTGTSTRSRFSRGRVAASAGSSITAKDNPTAPFTVLQPRRPARRDSGRAVRLVAECVRVPPQPERAGHRHVRYRIGNYYDGDFNGFELTSDYRITPKATASLGWTRQDIKLPYGSFVNNLVPIKAQLLVHDADQPVGAAAVQRPDRAVLVERALRAG